MKSHKNFIGHSYVNPDVREINSAISRQKLGGTTDPDELKARDFSKGGGGLIMEMYESLYQKIRESSFTSDEGSTSVQLSIDPFFLDVSDLSYERKTPQKNFRK